MSSSHPSKDLSNSIFVIVLTIILIFLLLIIRLFQLTIVKGNYYRRLAEQNRIKELIIEPERGKIIDRKGIELVKNLPADIKKNQPRLPSSRIYNTPEAIAPIIGYQQLANPQEIKNDHCLYKLTTGDKIGKKGVEKIFDCQLRGRSGKKLIEVNAQGKYLKTLTVLPPQPGQTIQLALDWELQKTAYQVFLYDIVKTKLKKGAIVAVKPQTGELLVFLSFPSFNPQVFSDGRKEIAAKILTDEDKPLFNRVAEGVYPPGSIFKLVVAAAALEEKAIDEKTEFEDIGTIKAGSLTFGNWYFLQYGKTEGMVDVVKAIRRSNDIFFYKTGALLGPKKIKSWAERFGYGHIFDIDLEQSAGLIPSPFWKEETIKDHWYLGDTYNLSIGQGYILVTPLQVTMATAAIANGGYICQPTLTKVQSSKFKVQSCQKIPISLKTLNLIQQGMREACSPGGTGWPFFDFKVQSSKFKVKEKTRPKTDLTDSNDSTDFIRFQPIQTACKTGTAESQTKETAPHAWFTAYAPADKPEIALTVLVENGGQGSDIAGPIAREILRAYFERKE